MQAIFSSSAKHVAVKGTVVGTCTISSACGLPSFSRDQLSLSDYEMLMSLSLKLIDFDKLVGKKVIFQDTAD